MGSIEESGHIPYRPAVAAIKANGASKHGGKIHSKNSKLDDDVLGQEFTDHVIKSMGSKTDPRMREIMASFIQHIHDFAREVQLTTDELTTGVELINWAGKMSNEQRDESQLLCDTIGLESLVDNITHRKLVNGDNPVTASAILGSSWKHDTPTRPNGTTISFDTPHDGQAAFMHGRVVASDTGESIPNATVEIWQASTNGLYSHQDPDQVEHNLRGKFVTDDDGEYSLYCLRPTPYPIPVDGPSGKLLGLLNRHEWRPAHIHLIIEADGYKSVTTQIFDEDSKYLEDDSVFAVKSGLTVQFKERKGDPEAVLDLEYDISLARTS